MGEVGQGGAYGWTAYQNQTNRDGITKHLEIINSAMFAQFQYVSSFDARFPSSSCVDSLFPRLQSPIFTPPPSVSRPPPVVPSHQSGVQYQPQQAPPMTREQHARAFAAEQQTQKAEYQKYLQQVVIQI